MKDFFGDNIDLLDRIYSISEKKWGVAEYMPRRRSLGISFHSDDGCWTGSEKISRQYVLKKNYKKLNNLLK